MGTRGRGVFLEWARPPGRCGVVIRVMLATVALAAGLSHGTAAADLVSWADDRAFTVLEAPTGGGQLAVGRREMPYMSGYLYVQLVATFHPPRGTARDTLLFEGPTNCAEVKAIGGGVEVSICVERFGDTREVTAWRLDRRTGRLVADPPRWRSPYAEAAAEIVADLRAGRRARAEAALAALGSSPDGQVEIDGWWDAHRLLVAWPAIAGAPSTSGRARLAPLVERLLGEAEDSGETGVARALAVDLRDVPRCGYLDDRGDGHPFRVGGARPRLAPVLRRAERLLRGGDATQVALASALAAALAAR
jgi:hypothetical protein